MLQSLFKCSSTLSRIRQGPLGKHIDAFVADLYAAGYARESVRLYVGHVATFSRYAARRGCSRSESIDMALVERFLLEFTRSSRVRAQARTALGHMMRHLGHRRVRGGAQPIVAESHAVLLAEFDRYMRDVRGLQPTYREDVLRVARRVLQWHGELRPGRPLSELCGEDVLSLVLREANRCVSSSSRSANLSHLRALLSYLRWAGILQADLVGLVPRVPSVRLGRIPQHLEWSKVRQAIDAIDPSTSAGKRDRALLLLLATTGLRSQEVRRLELRDIDWRAGELHVRRTKTGRERTIPLLQEAGEALADYVLHGRPGCSETRVFLRLVPPFGTMRYSSALSSVVRRRLAQCGIRPARVGAHLIRHSLATRMVQMGRPVKEVADVLGHRSIDTTAIYIKVALPQLMEIALPFPGGAA